MVVIHFSHSRYACVRAITVVAYLALASPLFAFDTTYQELCFLALTFGAGNTASIQLTNNDHRKAEARIERYSTEGTLLDKIEKIVLPGTDVEVRVELQSGSTSRSDFPQLAVPDLGWIRVLTTSKSLSVSLALEMLQGDNLITLSQTAVHRHPSTKKISKTSRHKWLFDMLTNLGTCAYFVNLSEYPVQVGMCEDDNNDCSSPELRSMVAPMGGIAFQLDHSRRYAVLESTGGYSAATSLRLTSGTKQVFDASSCIKFGSDNGCQSAPTQPKSAPRYVSPLEQKTIENSKAAKDSPAARRANTFNRTQQEMAEMVKRGEASQCVIATTPDGAEIYVDGLKMGFTPLAFNLLRHSEARLVEIRKQGYRTVTKEIMPDGKAVVLQFELQDDK